MRWIGRFKWERLLGKVERVEPLLVRVLSPGTGERIEKRRSGGTLHNLAEARLGPENNGRFIGNPVFIFDLHLDHEPLKI